MTRLVDKSEAELAAMVKDLDNQITYTLAQIWAKIGKSPDSGDFESPIEARLYDALFEAEIFEVRLQFPVGPYRADLAIPYAKIAIEADGADYHQDKSRDKKRDSYFKSQGWRVLRFTGSQIYRDPEGCAETVKQVLESKIILSEPAPLILKNLATGDVIEFIGLSYRSGLNYEEVAG